MNRNFCAAIGLIALVMLGLGQAAKADPIDPLFGERLINTCPLACTSVTLATDPGPGGLKTVKFTLDSTIIPSVVAGDVLIQEFGSAKIGDVIRFENIGGAAVAFIYSSDIATGFAADVGLPAAFQTNTLTIAENANDLAFFVPTDGQPGFCAACTGPIPYALASVDVPEPATAALLAPGALFWRWATRRRGAVERA